MIAELSQKIRAFRDNSVPVTAVAFADLVDEMAGLRPDELETIGRLVRGDESGLRRYQRDYKKLPRVVVGHRAFAGDYERDRVPYQRVPGR